MAPLAGGDFLKLSGLGSGLGFVSWDGEGYMVVGITPLGGGVIPFSLTFDQALALNTGFSAKNSILNAEGEYVFDGGIKAGIFDSDWAVNRPKMPKANVDIGKTTEGHRLWIKLHL